MDVQVSAYANYNFLSDNAKKKIDEKEREMKKIMQDLDAMRETEEQRQQRLACEKKEAEKNRKKQKKLMNLNSEIAYYRSRLMANPEDKIARGQLSMAKCQRYWVMYG